MTGGLVGGVADFLASVSPERGMPSGWVTAAGVIVASAVVAVVIGSSSSRRAHKAANRHKAELLASVSHELRTPLTSILGFAHTLKDEESLDVGERAEMLEDLVDEAEAMLTLVEDLLTMSVLDRGADIHVAHGVVDDVAASVARVVKRSPLLREAGISVEGTAAVRADEGRMHQIVQNLLRNAVDHGKPPVTVTIEREGSSVHIVVRDGGSGIPGDIVGRMFDRDRARPHRSGRTRSTGVGLWLSRQLAERMHGELVYLGSEGGTGFRLTLPAADSPEVG